MTLPMNTAGPLLRNCRTGEGDLDSAKWNLSSRMFLPACVFEDCGCSPKETATANAGWVPYLTTLRSPSRHLFLIFKSILRKLSSPTLSITETARHRSVLTQLHYSKVEYSPRFCIMTWRGCSRLSISFSSWSSLNTLIIRCTRCPELIRKWDHLLETVDENITLKRGRKLTQRTSHNKRPGGKAVSKEILQ